MSHDEPTPRRGTYRRRLAAAAVASVALHILLARGLAITSLGIDGDRPAADATAERKARPRTDFTIRVSKAPRTRPAHERPLEIAAARPARQPSAARPAQATAAERRPDEPAETAAARAPATPPRRELALAATAAPDRAAAAAAGPANTQADTTPAAAARADATPTAAPAAAAARARDTSAATAARWRPREVALLERLTAPAAARPAVVRDDAASPLPATTAASRAAADAAAVNDDADPVAAPAGTADLPADVAPAERAARVGIRAPLGDRGTAAAGDRLVPIPASAVAAADLAAARGRREAAGSAAGGRAAGRRSVSDSGPATGVAVADGVVAGAEPTPEAGPAAMAMRRGNRGGIAATTASAARGSDAEAAGTGPTDGPIVGPAAVGRGIGVAGRGAGDDANASPAGIGPGATSTPGRAALATGAAAAAAAAARADEMSAAPLADTSDEGRGSTPAPRAVGKTADGAGLTAAVASRTTSADDAGDDEERDGAELSVPRLPAARTGGSRDDGGLAAAAPRPPERLAAVALPAETRVRDVAEAFARRGRDARPDRRADPRAARADAMVDRGLEFLARAQQADGRWCLGRFAGSGPADVPQLASDTAATGLALLSFLGAGHDHFDGPHRDTVRRGLEFLLATQKPDGDLYLPADDLSNSCAWLYSHGIASIALCEAVGMTGDPLVKPAAAKACDFIAASQHPDRGGWRYLPRSDADLSVSGWMLVAVRSGKLAGVKTDPRTLAGVRTLLDAAASPDDPARYAYNPRKPDQRASELSGLCMTAVGGLMRLHTGATPDDPRVAAAARALAARRPAYDARGRDSYLWYYASQVLVHTGGPEWDAWYAALVDALAAAQETAGAKAGSWDPLGPRPDRWGRYGGRIYVTALHLLALEVPERRLPTYTAGD